MSLILDTHVFFWWITDDPRLESRHREAITNSSNVIHVSAVSGWEIGIKVKLGKWPEAAVLLPDLTSKVRAEGFFTLDLTLSQSEAAGALELGHKDQFDRLIAAQSLELQWTVATVDTAFGRLGCKTSSNRVWSARGGPVERRQLVR